MKDKKAMGCVIDSRQRKNVGCFFVKDPKITVSTSVNLYRGDNEYIGQLNLIPGDSGLKVEIAQTVKSIKPFDWFQMP